MSVPLDLGESAIYRIQCARTKIRRVAPDLEPVKIRVNQEVWNELVSAMIALEPKTTVTELKLRGTPVVLDLPSTHPKDFVLVYEV